MKAGVAAGFGVAGFVNVFDSKLLTLGFGATYGVGFVTTGNMDARLGALIGAVSFARVAATPPPLTGLTGWPVFVDTSAAP